MGKKDITFIGTNHAVAPLLNALSHTYAVTAYNCAPLNTLDPSVKLVVLPHGLIFLDNILKKYKKETSPPFYLQGLLKELWKEKPTTIVVMDFFRLWFIQAFLYALLHKGVTISVLSETKRVPKSTLSKIAFYFLLLILRILSFRTKNILVYEEIGSEFFKKRGFKKVNIITLPIENDLFYPSPEKTYKDNGILRLIMVARYASYKRHFDLLTALQQCIEQGVTNIHLTLIGGEGNGERSIHEYIHTHSLTPYISILPPLPKEKLRELYYKQDVLVLPSEYEAIGMVVPEAMACGLATITSDTVGANIYVQQNETGLIFKTGDPITLQKNITFYAQSNLAQKHGIFGSERMTTFFSAENCSDRFNQFINEQP